MQHTHHEGPLCRAYETVTVDHGDPLVGYDWTELIGPGECEHGSCNELTREDSLACQHENWMEL